MYLAPVIARLSPIGGHGLMLAVGIIEIVAGLLVAFKPRIGAYVVAAWLVGIIVNLLLIPGFFDIALRDLGLALGALALRAYHAVRIDAYPHLVAANANATWELVPV
jgi:Sugar-binding cellulase-like